MELLEKIRQGALTPEQGLERLKNLPFEDLGFARVDHHRTLRQGFPEVVFAPGKKRVTIRKVSPDAISAYLQYIDVRVKIGKT